VILALVQLALANADGKTGSSGAGCTCHGDSSRDTIVSVAADTTAVEPGAVVNITLLVGNGGLSEAGMNASATDGALGAGTGTKESQGEITHDGPSVLQTGESSFAFTWTAPTAAGTYTISAAGNATNADGKTTGDAWAFADDLEIVVTSAGGDSGDADTDADTDTDTDTDADTDADTGKDNDDAGCSCQASTPASMVLPALAALLFARRR